MEVLLYAAKNGKKTKIVYRISRVLEVSAADPKVRPPVIPSLAASMSIAVLEVQTWVIKLQSRVLKVPISGLGSPIAMGTFERPSQQMRTSAICADRMAGTGVKRAGRLPIDEHSNASSEAIVSNSIASTCKARQAEGRPSRGAAIVTASRFRLPHLLPAVMVCYRRGCRPVGVLQVQSLAR